jgi:hypothetical protein
MSLEDGNGGESTPLTLREKNALSRMVAWNRPAYTVAHEPFFVPPRRVWRNGSSQYREPEDEADYEADRHDDDEHVD